MATVATVAGIDLGGSRSRALLMDEGGLVLAEAELGPGNLAVYGEAEVGARLARLASGLGAEQEPAFCVCGAAGADDESGREQLSRLLRGIWPGAAVEVVPDPVLVLAAAGLDSGVALIAGTGSIAYGIGAGRTARTARTGGWGPRLGDEGSGFWAVREGVREILRARDQGRSLDPRQLELMAAAGAADPVELMHLFHREPDPARWAPLAPLALADPALLERAAAALAGLAGAVRARLGDDLPVVLAGGLLLNTPTLEAALRRRLDGDVRRLAAEPVLGAALLARSHLTGRG